MNRLGYWESIKRNVRAARDKLVEKWFSADEEAFKDEKKNVGGGGGGGGGGVLVFIVCECVVCVCVGVGGAGCHPPSLSYFFPRAG